MSRKPRYATQHGDPIEMLDACLKALKNLPAIYDEAYSMVGQADAECQDLLHEIELLTLSRKDASEVLAAMRENRAIRRAAKDFMTIAKPMRDFLSKNRGLVQELTNVQKQMENTKRNMRSRLYIPRIRHEKTEEFIKRTAEEAGKDPEAIRADLQKSGVYPGYDETAATSE